MPNSWVPIRERISIYHSRLSLECIWLEGYSSGLKQKIKYVRSLRNGGARGVMVIVVGNELEFKSWTRLIAFHIALIPRGKVWIQ